MFVSCVFNTHTLKSNDKKCLLGFLHSVNVVFLSQMILLAPAVFPLSI